MSEPTTARQFWVQAPGRGEILEGPVAEGGAGSVLVETRYSGISRGTEAMVFRGEVPSSQRAAMRAPFQDGEFPGPVKYGYSSVGEVVEGPAPLCGQTVFCLYPHQDRYRVPADAVVPVPATVPAARAVLAANMETAVNVTWDGGPAVGDRIVVIGAGVVGMLSAWLCRQVPGTEVTLVDVDRSRASVADRLGLRFDVAAPASADADLVIHASGQPAGLRAALAAAGVEATIVEASWYGSQSVALPLGEAFHARRLTIRSSQVGRIARGHAPRWGHRRRLALALELLADSRLDVLITGESPFEGLPGVMERLSRQPAGVLCHRLRYAT